MEFQNFLKFEEIKKEELSFAFRQYYDFKEQYEDFILFFRIGEFYETYFKDAFILSDILGVNLTKRKFNRQGFAPMAGIPYRSLNSAIQKLLKSNLKIAVVNQTDEKDENGKCIRKIERIYTKGTVFENQFLNAKENNYLASIYNLKNGLELCYADISTGDAYITKGTVNEIQNELARINPSELLILNDGSINPEIYSIYKYELLDEKFLTQSNLAESKAFSLVYNYSNHILDKFKIEFGEIKFYDVKNLVSIDFYTRKNLEITKNILNNSEFGSLVWAIDKCKTKMGKRKLLSMITSPLFNKNEIEKRQNAIQTLIENKNECEKLAELISTTGDILRLTSKISNGTIKEEDFIVLKECFLNVNSTNNILKKLKIELLEKFEFNCTNLEDFAEILDKTFDTNEKGTFIKNGANAELDLLLSQKEEILDKIKLYEKELKEKTKINSIKILEKKGSLLIELPTTATNPIGADFRLVKKTKTILKFTTDKLIELEEFLASTNYKMEQVKENFLLNLINFTKELNNDIRNYAKKIALLDCFISNVELTKEFNLKKPKITNNEFKIEKGSHIVLNNLIKNYEKLNLDFDFSNLILLTGKNGSGKSTLLKQIATTVILAQAGFFVPCKNFEFPLFDKLFAVSNVTDDFINKKSTHQMQIKQVAYCIENMTNKSLVLFDEIGKNTSYKDGVSILFGIIKYLIQNKCAKTIISTHFLGIFELLDEYENKINFLQILNENKREVIKGVSNESKGIETLKEENIPNEIIKYSMEAYSL